MYLCLKLMCSKTTRPICGKSSVIVFRDIRKALRVVWIAFENNKPFIFFNFSTVKSGYTDNSNMYINTTLNVDMWVRLIASRRVSSLWNNRPRSTSHAQQSTELHALLHGCCLHLVLIGGLCDDISCINDDDILESV